MLLEKIYTVSGIVQGVGFRPLCVRIAHRLGLKGSVSNTSDGVLLKLQGDDDVIARYLCELKKECPDVALIIGIEPLSQKTIGRADEDFIILKSVRSERQRVLLPPDMATCADCVADIKDKRNRRWRYPFTNCTNCGPRFSIVTSLPYDRPCTTMALFPMCPDCEREYAAEKDRRFHAQPNACPQCGPFLSYSGADGREEARREDALTMALEGLRSGKIIAIKGLGGFHLACDAFNEDAVLLLRQRKRRPRRPFAVMVRSLEEVQSMAELDQDDMRLLGGARAPILLLRQKASSPLAPSIAPGLSRVGIMLPYTPLHHLLMQEMRALVMTSANLSGDPLVSENQEAFERLRGICDGFLTHNRPIHMKIDDSVLLHHQEGPIIIRRARGYVPNPILTNTTLAPVVAAGAEMKGTFAFSQDGMIFPSQYLGDVKDLGTAQFYETALQHFKSLYNFAPRLLVQDLHPLYLSTAAAKKAFPELPLLPVQHHYAHLMACLAENNSQGPAVGLIMDGTGYGPGGTVWGGEILTGDVWGFERAGHLKTFRLPGGDRAVTEIWRCGFSLLVESVGAQKALEICEELWPSKTPTAQMLLKVWDTFPQTSSCGRLFDGIASIALKKAQVSYDGEAPMELEAQCRPVHNHQGGELFSLEKCVVDWTPLLRWLLTESPSAAQSGEALHQMLACAFAEGAAAAAAPKGITAVALSGGCWQNGLLLEKTLPLLRQRGLTPLLHRLLSPNDECVSVGQAFIGGCRLSESPTAIG